MSYVFAIFMVLMAAGGGLWLFKLSNENYDMASLLYGLAAAGWIGACLSIAQRVLP